MTTTTKNLICGVCGGSLKIVGNTARCLNCELDRDLAAAAQKSRPAYYLGGSDGQLHEVSYETWRRCGNG